MPDQLIVDLDECGQLRVAVQRPGEPFTPGAPAEFEWPLGDDALEDLRWYLEDYLRAPFGVYEDRGGRIEADLGGWGRQVFDSVFGEGPARDAYLRARERGDVELVFRSASPELLGRPWELMTDPGRDGPLALDVAGVSRSLLMAADAAQTVPVPGGRLRVLMVIARPGGTRDVGYQMIARPLLKRLDAVRGQVDLVVLRPPTLDALRAELARAASAGEPYQVVHFDGHGVMPGRPGGAGGALTFGGARDAEGVLVFEKPDGGDDRVPASVIAQVLRDAKVPVVVLNACQSGAVGKKLEAAVATRLLREGIASVVAMAYSVYAVAAAEFMAACYETLFAGGTVASAVTAGRKQMSRNPGRPSPKGQLPLNDWLVPVHYFRRDVSFPQARQPRPAELGTLADALKAARADDSERGTASRAGDLDAYDDVFVGRDALFYDLEAAARLKKAVVLTGPGGTGKTELAKAFGRWWRDTGGVEDPSLVFWHSFEPGVATFGLDGVISEIGHALWGAEFSLLEPQQQRSVALDALRAHRMLLIWDNFESVRTMPDPGRATPPLDEQGCAGLRGFLEALAGGSSSVLITSRADEDWLGGARRIAVGGLARHEANEYAEILLGRYPAARSRREGRAFGELMEWLDGHPLSMRLVLPRLETADAAGLLAGLRGTAPLAGDDAAAGRTRSLSASIAYSYAHLSEEARRLLPALSLFHGVADADVLGSFSGDPEVPGRFTGASARDWVTALDDAARVGLLTGLGAGLYRMHPALPGYLAAAWRAEGPAGHQATRDAALGALLRACASLGDWLSRQIESGDAGLAFTVIDVERHTLGSLLSHASDHRLWGAAQRIIQPLNDYWKARGLDAEADVWADRVLAAIETTSGTPPRLDTPAGALWLFVIGAQADRERRRRRLERAESAYLLIMRALEAMTAWPDQRRYQAIAYHQLGATAQDRGDLDQARNWYQQSLTIDEELGNRPGMASSYHNLGATAQRRGDLDQARNWYQQSLTISEELGNRPAMAGSYHQLGIVAQERGDLDQARNWYQQSLTISEELGDRPAMAMTYHQLGMVTQRRGDLDQARNWYQQSLTISEELGDRPGMAMTYGQLSLLAEDRGRLPEAMAWTVKCVALFAEFPHPLTGPAPRHLVRLARQLGMEALAEAWRAVTGNELPRAVREYAESRLQAEG